MWNKALCILTRQFEITFYNVQQLHHLIFKNNEACLLFQLKSVKIHGKAECSTLYPQALRVYWYETGLRENRCNHPELSWRFGTQAETQHLMIASLQLYLWQTKKFGCCLICWIIWTTFHCTLIHTSNRNVPQNQELLVSHIWIWAGQY